MSYFRHSLVGKRVLLKTCNKFSGLTVRFVIQSVSWRFESTHCRLFSLFSISSFMELISILKRFSSTTLEEYTSLYKDKLSVIAVIPTFSPKINWYSSKKWKASSRPSWRARVSAAKVLFTTRRILFDYQLSGWHIFVSGSVRKTIYPHCDPPSARFWNEASAYTNNCFLKPNFGKLIVTNDFEM